MIKKSKPLNLQSLGHPCTDREGTNAQKVDTILDRSIEMVENHLTALKALKDAHSHMSGNDTDSMLQCFSRIANEEPESGFYQLAVNYTSDVSCLLDQMNENLMCMIDDIYGLAGHFSVFDGATGFWFHDTHDKVSIAN